MFIVTWIPSDVVIVSVDLLPDVVTLSVIVFADGVVSVNVVLPSASVVIVTVVVPAEVVNVWELLSPGAGIGMHIVDPSGALMLTAAPSEANVVVALVVALPFADGLVVEELLGGGFEPE